MKNEDRLSTAIEMKTRHIPSIVLLGLALASIGVSAWLWANERRGQALFMGQWAPTLLGFATFNKIAKTFSAPYDEEQRIHHGGHASPHKSPEELARQLAPEQRS
ncbi:MAG TPA: hypothetical protein VLQ93_06515 [Myxococcaceae bacterium]|nr:hypothetical protein [Myxococcaceae bacterium]